MKAQNGLLLRDVELDGIRTEVLVRDGLIAGIGAECVRGVAEIDGRGGALIPGLIDHHIHLFATAARLDSVDLSGAHTRNALLTILRDAAADRAPDAWIRAVNFDDSALGLISRDDLDILGVANPMRIQDRTGALWVLNTPALERVLDGEAAQPRVEYDASGRPTGRVWRGDAWLRGRIKQTPPSLRELSCALARHGVTGVTDASATNGPDEARLLARARASGELAQSLCLMSGGAIPPAAEYEIGPVKILPDERDLPELGDMIERMRSARRLGRSIAVHCVTAAELALTLAAFEAIGARHGDRLEHGGSIPAALIGAIAALCLTIVTQPGFIHERGDRYLRDIDADELPGLYRLASLRTAGIALAAGSDAPYGDIDPWRAIQCARDRVTKNGAILGGDERMAARAALGLYLGGADDPGGAERRVALGGTADLCLLKTPLAEALAEPAVAQVAATIRAGEIIYRAD